MVRDIVIAVGVAIVGSLLTAAGGWARRRLQARRLTAKYPLAGTFLTSFEDEQSGEQLVSKAVSKIRQDGLSFEGETTELHTGRTWVLNGQIEPGGYVHGFYRAEDPHDTGIGTFFLEIRGDDGDLDGLWAGYDSVNHEVTGGKYRFLRCPEVAIAPASFDDAGRVGALLGEALGDQYVTAGEVRRLIEDDESECLIATTSVDDSLVGVVTGSLIAGPELESALPVGQENLLHRVPAARHAERVGLIRSVAVHPSAEGRGTATLLVGGMMRVLKELNADILLCIGWKPADGCHIAGVLTVSGFAPVLEVDDFWLLDSQAAEYDCPSCGNPCRCAAVVFARAANAGITPRSQLAPKQARATG